MLKVKVARAKRARGKKVSIGKIPREDRSLLPSQPVEKEDEKESLRGPQETREPKKKEIQLLIDVEKEEVKVLEPQVSEPQVTEPLVPSSVTIIFKEYDKMLFKMSYFSSLSLSYPYRLWVITDQEISLVNVRVFKTSKDLQEAFLKEPTKWFYMAECGEVFNKEMFTEWALKGMNRLGVVPYYRRFYNYKTNESISLRDLDSGCMIHHSLFSKSLVGHEKDMLSTDPASICVSKDKHPSHIGERLLNENLYKLLPEEVKGLLRLL